MDSFEQVIAGLLRQKGYWVSQGFKVDLSKEEKIVIGRPTTPRWEIDLLAYSGARNELLVVECKSYLDSTGVAASDLREVGNSKSRYKLFVDEKLRGVVFGRLQVQLYELGFIPENAKFKLALAAGKIRNEKDREELFSQFKQMNWDLYDSRWIVSALKDAAGSSYFDSISHVVSKIINRNSNH